MRFAIALLLALLLFSSACAAEEIESPSMVQAVKAVVIVEGSGEIAGNLSGRSAEIEVLSFQDGVSQKVLSLSERLEINGKTIVGEKKLDSYGNRQALFRVNETGKFTYKIEALIQTDSALREMPDFDLSQKIAAFQEFAQPSKNIESNSETIRTIALNVFESQSFLQTIVDATQWVHGSLEYDLAYFPENYSAVSTLESRKGVCDEFAVLEAALLRAKGIPTRIMVGMSYNPLSEKGWDSHAWIESFNPDSGWVPADPVFAEAGVVDGTHIGRGFFSDPSEASISKISAPQTADVSIDETSVSIEMQESTLFEKSFSVEAGDIVLSAQKWVELEIMAKNEKQSPAIGWFTLVLPLDFRKSGKTRLFLFQPGEEKEIGWNIFYENELKKNQYMTGAYRIISMGEETEKSLKILPNAGSTEEASLRLLALIPIVKEGMLEIEITLENLGKENALAEIAAQDFNETAEIGALETKRITITAPAVEGTTCNVSIAGPGIDFKTAITVHGGIAAPAAPIPYYGQAMQENNLLEEITKYIFTMEAAIIAGILIGIVIMGALLKKLLAK